MPIFLVIDKVLALPPVRWAVLIFAIIFLALFGFSALQVKILKIRVDQVTIEKDKALANIQAQNEAIKKAELYAQDLSGKVKAAQETAGKVQADTMAAVRDVLKKELRGSCSDMIAESVRILQGADNEN